MSDDSPDAQHPSENTTAAPPTAPEVHEPNENVPSRRVVERENPEQLQSALGRMRGLLRRVGPTSPDMPAGKQKIHASVGGVAIGQVSGNIHVYNSNDEAASLELARNLFRASIRDRDRFISQFLGQALRQAGTSFTLSVVFMAIGGALVLFAGIMALATAQTNPATNYLLLASGLGGLIVGASGAAFARRADKSRKHLAEQADRMHAQLLDERKFVQAGELLTGVKDPTLNDQARIALALKLLGADPPPQNWSPVGSDDDAPRSPSNISQAIDDASGPAP
jgi:hypothetical protein